MSKIGLIKGINKSNEYYDRAKKYIASGTSTFSRAPGVFPDGGAPKVLVKQNLAIFLVEKTSRNFLKSPAPLIHVT